MLNGGESIHISYIHIYSIHNGVYMIEHEGRQFDDSVLRPYLFSRRLLGNYYGNECEIFVVSGMPEGIGKTAYVAHVQADIKGYQGCKDQELLKWLWERNKPKDVELWDSDWETIKTFIKYPPEDVVDTCMDMVEKDRKDVCFHWDDSGTWLNAMDFHDPFVIAFMKYLSLARSNWGGVILSTPVEDWVLKKLRTAKGVLHVEIKRMSGTDRRYVWRPRVATCYKMVKYRGNPRAYWPKQWKDAFMAIMPDSFYKWYNPRRKLYTKIAVQLMKKALAKRRDKGWIKQVERDEAILAEVEKHINRANDKSQDFNELLDQKTQEEH